MKAYAGLNPKIVSVHNYQKAKTDEGNKVLSLCLYLLFLKESRTSHICCLESRYTFRVHILPILMVNFIGTLGYSIVMPFLIYLVAKFGGNAVVYGVLGATYSAFQLVGAPILGKYSDKFGRKSILLVSQLGTLIAWLLFLAALLLPNLPLLSVDVE